MNKLKVKKILIPIGLCIAVVGCKVPAIVPVAANKNIPQTFIQSSDSSNSARSSWRSFFNDPNLVDLIDTALKNNQELKITMQEIEISKNEILMRKGAILPSVGLRGGNGFEKVARYTSQGAGDASTEITPGKKVPDILPDWGGSIVANWEVDIWRKLRNAK